MFQNQLVNILESTFIDGDKLLIKTNSIFLDESNVNKAVNELQKCYYKEFYCRTNENLSQGKDSMIYKKRPKSLIANLVEANHTIDGWDEDWEIERVNDRTKFTVVKNAGRRMVMPGDFIIKHGYNSLKAGSMVDIKIRKDLNQQDNIFYFAFGSTLIDEYIPGIIRFYWNCTPTGAISLINNVTSVFNSYKLPFELKCLKKSQDYLRADCAVLYVNKRYFKICVELLKKINQIIDPELYPDSPLFTRCLSKGFSFAESPVNNASFGVSRTFLIANAVVRSAVNGIGRDNWLNEVCLELGNNKLRLEYIYLNSDSFEFYDETYQF